MAASKESYLLTDSGNVTDLEAVLYYRVRAIPAVTQRQPLGFPLLQPCTPPFFLFFPRLMNPADILKASLLDICNC